MNKCTCTLCLFSTYQPSILKLHVNRCHDQESRFKCSACSCRFSTYRGASLHEHKIHKIDHHKLLEDDEYQIYCTPLINKLSKVMEFIYVGRTHMQSAINAEHSRTHNNNPSYQCNCSDSQFLATHPHLERDAYGAFPLNIFAPYKDISMWKTICRRMLKNVAATQGSTDKYDDMVDLEILKTHLRSIPQLEKFVRDSPVWHMNHLENRVSLKDQKKPPKSSHSKRPDNNKIDDDDDDNNMDLLKKQMAMLQTSMALMAAKRAKKRKLKVDSLDDGEEFDEKSKGMILGKVLKARAKKVANLEEEENAHRKQGRPVKAKVDVPIVVPEPEVIEVEKESEEVSSKRLRRRSSAHTKEKDESSSGSKVLVEREVVVKRRASSTTVEPGVVLEACVSVEKITEPLLTGGGAVTQIKVKRSVSANNATAASLRVIPLCKGSLEAVNAVLSDEVKQLQGDKQELQRKLKMQQNQIRELQLQLGASNSHQMDYRSMGYNNHPGAQTHHPSPDGSPYPMYHQHPVIAQQQHSSRAHRPAVAPSPAPPIVPPSPQPTHGHQTSGRSSHSQSNQSGVPSGSPNNAGSVATGTNPSCSLAKLQQLTHGIERCQSIPPQSSAHHGPLTPPPNMNMGMSARNMNSSGGMNMNMNNMRHGSSASAVTAPGGIAMSQYHKQYNDYYSQMSQHGHPMVQSGGHPPPRSASAAPAATVTSNNHAMAGGGHQVANTITNPVAHTSTSSSSSKKSSKSSSNASGSHSAAAASNNNSNAMQQGNNATSSSASSSASGGSLMPPNAPMGHNQLMQHYNQYLHHQYQQYFFWTAGFLNPHSAAAIQMMHGAAGHSSEGQNQYQDPRVPGQPGASMYPYGHYPTHPGLMSPLNPSLLDQMNQPQINSKLPHLHDDT